MTPRRDINEANVVRQGLASAGLEDGATEGQVPAIGADGELEFRSPNGGSQPFVRTTLRHSLDFANLVGSAPVTTFSPVPESALTLPPSLYGAGDHFIDVLVYNPTAVDVAVGASLVVQSADGTVWIEQDTGSDQVIAAGANASIDLDTNEGGAGSGLSWNAVTKQLDITTPGVYSAFLTLDAVPA